MSATATDAGDHLLRADRDELRTGDTDAARP